MWFTDVVCSRWVGGSCKGVLSQIIYQVAENKNASIAEMGSWKGDLYMEIEVGLQAPPLTYSSLVIFLIKFRV